ncbi:TPA: DNA polymerase III subunit beta [Stenotrophomonas maltophilia]|uniref:DNA polymerase III subunit beta n=1 Tax=Stenotrophomonas maltophilia TaxID=40324 RepID=UPI001462AB3E|nr:DNA polymerase III subunit beta [Stenotrophomonas maltophilia]MBH1381987.1 DNA polymerase III subunit beta [Stenotrophomonas maltophilia]MBH1398438.1 DNA polymerase III subunit beta [Stenotrophomonas maltophilia]MBH1470979.1 DNA polymerase III subunit beta [Stenotrophomonas maltophilia]MBH1474571.1 DNA polymerase III subunit beta [Stenotrophomonas maltophilia]QJP17978.1 DNA polymerase III subunit beta [Stenotrophomonas maltophilia]
MRFTLQREAFLKPLAQVVNVVERRQTLPVLANFLVQVQNGQLSLTGTDLEVEMVSRIAVEDAQDGETTIPARKLFEIIRALPDGCRITVSQTGDKITVQAGRSRFTLATLPSNDFPSVDEVEATERVAIGEATLKELIERTAFAMAQQDVRYYLNGLLFDLRGDALRTVATDGHRLALCETDLAKPSGSKRQIIVPRKGVTELQRLLESGDREIELEVGRSHVRVKRDDVTFTSKLIDGRFPDYEAVIPIGADREVKVDREALRASLQRAAILSNEKYRGIRVEVSPGNLKISAHNPEQEEAQEEIEADTTVSDLAIGFNVNYLLDALSALRDEEVIIQLRDSNSSALVRESSSEKSRHVVMPLRL